MITLSCAIFGVAGSAFSVQVNEGDSVGVLKKAIRDQSGRVIMEPMLFLAKKDEGRGPWLTKGEVTNGVRDTADLKLLMSVRAKLRNVGLSHQDVGGGVEQKNQVNVLVVPKQCQQDQVVSAQDSFEMFRENRARIRRIEMLVEQTLAALPHKASKSCSDAEVGCVEINRLKKRQMIAEAAPVENGEPFWSAEIQLQAEAIGIEAEFDAFITPFFNDVLSGCGMVFVKNERDLWLFQSPFTTKSIDFKPLGFATHPGMLRMKPVRNDEAQRGNGSRVGNAEEDVLDCLVVFKSEPTISNAAFGRVIRYLKSICPNATANVVLFDRRSFWLIYSYKAIAKVETSSWVNKGSKAVFQSFISRIVAPWVTILVKACSSLGVHVVEDDAFLGRGAFGCVFKVAGQDGEIFALKIAEQIFVERLCDEKEALANAQDTGLTIRPVGEVLKLGDGAALLLSPVGDPMPRPTTLQGVQRLFGLLGELHAKGLVHGDPRVPNVIVCDGKPLWIDLVVAMEASPASKRIDANILTESILGFSHTVDPALEQLMDNYGDSSTQENLNQLAEAVWQTHGLLLPRDSLGVDDSLSGEE